MSCLLNAGEEILIVDPLYVVYTPILPALDLKVSVVLASPEHKFESQLHDLITAINTNTRVVLINTLGNPTGGAIISHETSRALACYCFERCIWLVYDEVYPMFTYEKPHVLRQTASRISW